MKFHAIGHFKRRYPQLACFVQFAAVGATGMVVDVTCFVAALLFLPASAARALAIWIAMTWNFVGNRTITFADCKSDHIGAQYVAYCASCLIGAAVNWAISLTLWSLVPPLQHWPLIPAAAGVAAGTLFNFTLCRRLVFSQPAKSDASLPAIERRRAA